MLFIASDVRLSQLKKKIKIQRKFDGGRYEGKENLAVRAPPVSHTWLVTGCISHTTGTDEVQAGRSGRWPDIIPTYYSQPGMFRHENTECDACFFFF